MAGNESPEIRAMRHMAWERAKGELRSMLHTFRPIYGNGGTPLPTGYEELDAAIKEFIQKVEDEGLYE